MKRAVILFFLVFSFLYLAVNYLIGSNNLIKLKSLVSYENKEFIKKYFFPYKFISQQEQIIFHKNQLIFQQEKLLEYLEPYLAYSELKFKELGNDIETSKEEIVLSNTLNLKKIKLSDGFLAGIHLPRPGSGYIDFYNENIFVLSARGVLAYSDDLNIDSNFKQIYNNIDKFINLDQFSKHKWFSIKDLLIHENQIFISFTEEIKEDCWNTSIIHGDINYENINFKKFFSAYDCVHSKHNIDNEFNAHQSGGRIVAYDKNNILFSVGEYRSRFLAQDQNSINGKILKIDLNNANFEIISMGHRNPQGLYYDRNNGYIIEAEHGPQGGDEINIIELNFNSRDNIQNYGWPVVSAGEHYGGRTEKNKQKYKKYPLIKSHLDMGFIEPLKSFVPSIGISEIVKIKENNYVVSSLKEHHYFSKLIIKK